MAAIVEKVGENAPAATIQSDDGAKASILPPSIDDDISVYKAAEGEAMQVDRFMADNPELVKGLPPGKVLRFLRARRGEEEATKIMLGKHVEWFNRIKPNELTSNDVDDSALKSGCWRYLGDSGEGCPMLEVRLSLWNPHEYPIEVYELYIAYFVAESERLMKTASQFVIIFDMGGWAFWHAQYLSYIKRLVDIAQNQYPDRMRKVLLINAPLMFRGVWSVIKPWLDPVTAAKVFFASDEAGKLELVKELSIDRHMIPIRYGGLMDEATEDKLPIPGFKLSGT
jgi:hypothetical protein